MTYEPLVSYIIAYNDLVLREAIRSDGRPYDMDSLMKNFNKYDPCNHTTETTDGTTTINYKVRLIRRTTFYTENDKIDYKKYDVILDKMLKDGEVVIEKDSESWTEPGTPKPICGSAFVFDGMRHVGVWLFTGKRLYYETNFSSCSTDTY